MWGAEPAERDNRSGRRGDLWMVGATIAVGLALVLLRVGVLRPLDGALWWQLLSPVAVVSVAALWRRTAPLASVLIGTAAVVFDIASSGGSLGTLLIYTNVLYDATRFGRPVFGRGLLIASVVVTGAITGLAAIGDPGHALIAAAGGALMLILPVLTGLELRHYRERAAAERLRADQAEQLAESGRRQAVAAERARMARELHDVIANHLSAIAIHATGAETVGGESLDPRVRAAIKVIRANSVQGLAEMRQMIDVLREPDEAGRPGETGQRRRGPDQIIRPRLKEVDLLVRQARDAGLEVTMSEKVPVDDPLPVAVDLAAYRIVQESLTNALKHAEGGRVEVRIERGVSGLTVTVDSAGNGRPSREVPGAGYGLVGMRERVTLLGGVFAAGPHGDGFRVRAELPG